MAYHPPPLALKELPYDEVGALGDAAGSRETEHPVFEPEVAAQSSWTEVLE